MAHHRVPQTIAAAKRLRLATVVGPTRSMVTFREVEAVNTGNLGSARRRVPLGDVRRSMRRAHRHYPLNRNNRPNSSTGKVRKLAKSDRAVNKSRSPGKTGNMRRLLRGQAGGASRLQTVVKKFKRAGGLQADRRGPVCDAAHQRDKTASFQALAVCQRCRSIADQPRFTPP